MPRNAAGVYTLPLPPVEPNTVIESGWANDTLADIAEAIEQSLSRTGQGGMLAPFRMVDGTVASPAISFIAEPSSGLWRQSSGVLGMSVQGVNQQTWNNNGTTLAGTTTVLGDINIGGVLTAAGIVGPLTMTSLSVVGDLTVGGTATFDGASTFNGAAAANGKLTTAASTTTQAGLNVPHGTAPTAAVNGDIWTTTTQLVVRLNGSNRALATLAGAQTFTAAQTFTGTVAMNGGVTIGDAAADALTFNSNVWTIPSTGVNFTGGGANAGIGIGRLPTGTLDVASTPGSTGLTQILVANLQSTVTGSLSATSSGHTFPSAFSISVGSGNTPIHIGQSGLTGTGYIAFHTNATEKMRITSEGNVGMGASSPVTFGAGYTSLTVNNTTGSTLELTLGNTRTASFATSSAAGVLGTHTAIPLAFITGGTEKARLTNAGDFGLGTTSPNAGGAGVTTLTVNGSTTSVLDCNVGGVRTGTISCSAPQTIVGTMTSSPLAFWTNGAEKARITPEGNVGVNLTAPSNYGANFKTVCVNSVAGSSFEGHIGGVKFGSIFVGASSMVVGTDSGNTNPLLFNTGGAERARVDTTGLWTLKLTAAPQSSMLFLVGGSTAGSIGHPTATTTTYNSGSDRRLKRNIRPVQDVGRIIDNIPVVSFDWKPDGKHCAAGIIAQDMHALFPEAVHVGGDEHEDPWAIDLSKLVPVLLRELQCLRQRLEGIEHHLDV